MATQSLVERGSLWRIGNGRRIKAFGDKWLPDLEDQFIQTIGSTNPTLAFGGISWLRNPQIDGIYRESIACSR